MPDIRPDSMKSDISSLSATPARPIFSDIGDLPVIEMSNEKLERNKIVGFDSRDSRSRPFNLLRSQLLKQMQRNKWRMIGVTSATPGAGKTFTSVNLAAALAPTASAPVVLCDFDLRRGSVEKTLGISAENGVASYLKGETPDPGKCVLRINMSQLAVIPTSVTRQGSSELLATAEFGALISRLRALPEETIIICDLPPVFANDDAIICMEHLDAYLLVVDHGITTGKHIEETMRLLNPAPCAGTILNRYKGGFADPYGYGYGDTYGLKDYS
jgi:protein-tyrosine kinase